MNKNCREKNIQKINHFCKKECMNIDGISLKTVRKMYDLGLVTKWQDLYSLKYEDLINDGFGEKTSKNIIDQVEKSKNNDQYRVLMSLGIPMIGRITAKKIIKVFGNFGNLKNATLSDVASVDGVGDVAAMELTRYFVENSMEIEDISAIFKNVAKKQEEKKEIKSEVSSTNKPNIENVEHVNNHVNNIAGKRILATGKLTNFTRQSIIDSVEDHGGIYASTIGINLDYLIVGENAGAAKLKKAKELNINMISEDEYLKMIS
jgi:DNA ligase (NAD+)